MKKMPKIKMNTSTLIIAVTVIVCGFFIVKGIEYIPTISFYNQKSEEIKAEQEYEQKKIDEIDEDKKNKDTDEYKEKVARENLGMVKKGEKIYIDISGQE